MLAGTGEGYRERGGGVLASFFFFSFFWLLVSITRRRLRNVGPRHHRTPACEKLLLFLCSYALVDVHVLVLVLVFNFFFFWG